MARQARSRPTARPAPKAAPAQSRPAHTQAAPPAHAPAPGVPAQMAPGQKQPGMFAQMATTAAGVAVGSTMAHGMTSMLFGGGSAAAGEAAAPAVQEGSKFSDERSMSASCQVQAKDFTSCLNATSNDMSACNFYLDQLKACQQAAAPY